MWRERIWLSVISSSVCGLKEYDHQVRMYVPHSLSLPTPYVCTHTADRMHVHIVDHSVGYFHLNKCWCPRNTYIFKKKKKLLCKPKSMYTETIVYSLKGISTHLLPPSLPSPPPFLLFPLFGYMNKVPHDTELCYLQILYGYVHVRST